MSYFSNQAMEEQQDRENIRRSTKSRDASVYDILVSNGYDPHEASQLEKKLYKQHGSGAKDIALSMTLD